MLKVSIKSPRNAQLQLNELNTSIKVAKRTASYYQSLIDAFKDVLKGIEVAKYQRKLQKYKKLLTEAYSYSEMIIHASEIQAWHVDPLSYNQKRYISSDEIIIIKSLINYIESYLETDDSKLKAHIQQLEGRLSNYRDESNIYIASGDIHHYIECRDSALMQVKSLKNDIYRIHTELFNTPKRDLRLFFRSIIRFRFKNMDDNSGDDNVVRFFQSTFVNLNLNIKWKRKNLFNIYQTFCNQMIS